MAISESFFESRKFRCMKSSPLNSCEKRQQLLTITLEFLPNIDEENRSQNIFGICRYVDVNRESMTIANRQWDDLFLGKMFMSEEDCVHAEEIRVAS